MQEVFLTLSLPVNHLPFSPLSSYSLELPSFLFLGRGTEICVHDINTMILIPQTLTKYILCATQRDRC